MALLLLVFALPLAFVASACAVLGSTPGAADEGEASTVRRIGGSAWFGLAFTSAALALLARNNWVHLFWSVKFPLLGLTASAGVLLAERRRAEPEGASAFSSSGGLVAVLATLVALGSLPVVLLSLGPRPSPPSRATGRPLVALVETARYGFGGPIPQSMRPEVERQIERGLGHPPREVTVTMGSTGIAAGAIALVAVASLLGRALRRLGLQAATVTLVPMTGVALLLAQGILRLDALWDNEPWLVQCYGPTLAIALLALVLLVLASAGSALVGRRRVPTSGRSPSPS